MISRRLSIEFDSTSAPWRNPERARIEQHLIKSDPRGIVLEETVQSLSPQHVFLLADEAAYEVSGAGAVFERVLDPFRVTRIPVRCRLPDTDALEAIRTRLPSEEVDLIVAVGGGTTIDLAKAVRRYGYAAATTRITGADSGKVLPLNARLLAAPTTSGSGSEATHFAVMYAGSTKQSLTHASLLPDIVYLNSGFVRTVPAIHRAATGLDVLAQGIESYWAASATDASQAWAAKAIQAAWRYLPDHVRAPDEETCSAMSEAAYLAGRAINATKTTACHALSYTMTRHFGIPHGIAVALTLGPMLVHNARDEKGGGFVPANLKELLRMLACQTPEEACTKVQDLLDEIAGGHRLQDHGVESDSDVSRIVTGVNRERLANNPRVLAASDLAGIVDRIR